MFSADVDWSVWGPCSQTCGQAGVQKRTAAIEGGSATSCMDNGFLEECVMASGRKQTRPCNRRPCPATASPMSNSGWIPVRYTTKDTTVIKLDFFYSFIVGAVGLNLRRDLNPRPIW